MTHEELASLLVEDQPTLARDLLLVIDRWDAVREWQTRQTAQEGSPSQDDSDYDAVEEERSKRLQEFRRALEEVIY
jgi:hypothetical protein